VTQLSRRATIDRHRARFQQGLVAFQVSVSLVLVIAALSFVQTFRNLASVPLGFESEDTMAVTFFDLAARDLPADRKVAFQRQLTEMINSNFQLWTLDFELWKAAPYCCNTTITRFSASAS
jgi:hypothetical protein